MMPTIRNLRLPLDFDPVALKEDLARVQAGEWAPHYNGNDYRGEWRGAALRSLSGESHQLLAQGQAFSDTGLLARCSYFRKVLSGFCCPLKSVRLLSLSPGSSIREHRDPELGLDHGEVRIHIPVQTGPGVEFYSDGERLCLREGGCYYVNVSLPHRVANHDRMDRVHLVIDAVVNDWVRELFTRGIPVEAAAPASTGFEAFRERVWSDAALQRRLYDSPDCILTLARDLGFDVPCLSESVPTRDRPAEGDPGAWIPIRVQPGDTTPLAEWAYFGSRPLSEPFFEDSVRAMLRHPFTRAFRYRAPLPECAAAPDGLIFHMSRCGSTLLARALSALPGSTVISESAALDETARAGNVPALRALAAAWRRGPGPLFWKLDCWHVHKLPVFEEAFPDTPWVFLYRDPVEVLVSHRRSPGRQALPGAMDPAVLGLQPEDIFRREEWCARVLANICESALRHSGDPRALFLNYRLLPEAAWGVVAEHFGLPLTAGSQARMVEASRANAKHPSLRFQDDAEEKRRDASPDLRRLAGRFLDPLFAQLEHGRGAMV